MKSPIDAYSLEDLVTVVGRHFHEGSLYEMLEVSRNDVASNELAKLLVQETTIAYENATLVKPHTGKTEPLPTTLLNIAVALDEISGSLQSVKRAMIRNAADLVLYQFLKWVQEQSRIPSIPLLCSWMNVALTPDDPDIRSLFYPINREQAMMNHLCNTLAVRMDQVMTEEPVSTNIIKFVTRMEEMFRIRNAE